MPAYVAVAAVWALTALTISHCSPSCVLLVESAVSASSSSCGYGGGLEEDEAQSEQVPQVSIRALVVRTDCAGCSCGSNIKGKSRNWATLRGELCQAVLTTWEEAAKYPESEIVCDKCNSVYVCT